MRASRSRNRYVSFICSHVALFLLSSFYNKTSHTLCDKIQYVLENISVNEPTQVSQTIHYFHDLFVSLFMQLYDESVDAYSQWRDELNSLCCNLGRDVFPGHGFNECFGKLRAH